MTRLSVRRTLGSRLFWGSIALAILPLMLLSLVSLVVIVQSGLAFSNPLPVSDFIPEASGTRDMMSLFVVRGAYIQFSVIFAAIFFGVSAIREEVDSQTLHYLLLQPTPRWILVLGKYFGFLIVTAPMMMLSVLVAHVISVIPYGLSGAMGELTEGARILQALKQAAVVTGALAVWSAFFLLAGTVVKNLFFALIVYGWETALQFLPATLKQFTIGHYLGSFLPNKTVEMDSPFAFVAETPNAFLSFGVLGGIIVLCVGGTCALMLRKECSYGGS